MTDGPAPSDRPLPSAPARVVVGVDGSPGARAALDWALEAAARTGAVLEVVSAFPVDPYWTDAYLLDRARIDALRADTEARAREMVEQARRRPALAPAPGTTAPPVEVIVVAGAVAEHLVQLSQGASLLVVGSRGRGSVRSTLLGSVALHCSTHAACPVVVVRPWQRTTPSRVVVGLDGTATARAALARAAEAATEAGAQLVAVSAFQLPEYWSDLGVAFLESLDDVRNAARQQAESMVTGVLGESPGVPVRVVTVHGPPADVLAQQAAGADLLVVGSRSRSRLSGMLLGSVALHCVVHAPCPVMVVHPSRHAPEPVGQVRAGATG